MSESEQPAGHEQQSGDGEGDGVGMTGGFAADPQGGEGGEEPSSKDPSDFTNYPEGEGAGAGGGGGEGASEESEGHEGAGGEGASEESEGHEGD